MQGSSTRGSAVAGRAGLPRRAAGLAGAAAALALAATPVRAQPAAQPQQVRVMLDQAKLLKMPEHVDTVVIGSPIVADVTLLKKNNLVVVTGKGFGQTNVIFLDNTGAAVSEAIVTVERAAGLMTVQRGLDRESYSCTPRCEPAVSLGDSSKFLQDSAGQITARNGLAAH